MTDGLRDGAMDAALARDWITLVHSELAALAVDREAQENLHALLNIWAGASGAALAILASATPARSDERAGGWAAPDAAARAAPLAAALGAGEPEIERLRRVVAGLEARIAELERHAGGTSGQRRRRGRPAAGDQATG